MDAERPIDGGGAAPRGRGRPACCYELRQEDERSEGDEEEGVREVGMEGRPHPQIHRCTAPPSFLRPPASYQRRF